MTKFVAPVALFIAVLACARVTAEEAPPTAGQPGPAHRAASATTATTEAPPSAGQPEAKPAGAPSGTKPAAEAKTASKQSPDELVCRNERETGSRMSKKVCRTRAQIDEQQREVEEMKRQTQAKGNQGNRGG